MSDAATRWICPYWRADNQPDFTRVFVLNPNAEPASVTGHWFDMNGNVVSEHSETVGARSHWIFTAGTLGSGWLRITSDRPVVPWGETPFGGVEPTGNTTMTFYREDLLMIPIHPLP
jgi:hypothetical protein